VTWRIILLEIAIRRRWEHCGHKEMDIVSTATVIRSAVAFKWYSTGTKEPKVYHYTNRSLNHWYKGGWIHAFMLFTPNCDPPFWMSQHQTKKHFSSLLFSKIEPVWILASLSCSQLTGGVSSAAAVAPLLQGWLYCAFRDALLHLGCNKWLFELLFVFLSAQQGIFTHRTPGYFLFFWPFSVNPRDGCVWISL